MRYQGRLIEWNDERGFGFIEPNGGGERVFLHIKAVRGAKGRPALGQAFNYTLGTDERGRPRALVAETRQLSARRHLAETRQGSSAWRLEAGIAGLVMQLLLVLLSGLPTELLGVFATFNLIAFGMYWLDKRSARAEAQRTPEAHLHLIAVLGGWPACLIAQRLLRHKSVKQPFQTVFWMTVAANILVLLLLAAGPGRELLETALGVR